MLTLYVANEQILSETLPDLSQLPLIGEVIADLNPVDIFDDENQMVEENVVGFDLMQADVAAIDRAASFQSVIRIDGDVKVDRRENDAYLLQVLNQIDAQKHGRQSKCE